jgi:hypothetical protein
VVDVRPAQTEPRWAHCPASDFVELLGAVRFGARRWHAAKLSMSDCQALKAWDWAFLILAGQGRWKCRVRVSVLGRVWLWVLCGKG